jgi:protoporphyrinogen oxidase
MMQTNLALVWHGIRSNDPVNPVPLELNDKGYAPLKVAIIGGGLAGLTAAAYLSEQYGVEGVLFERSPQLGGRAFTYEKSGFTLNYGAHAIYGIDRHTISLLEKELGLSFSSKQVDKRKVMYRKHDQLTPAPLDFVNLMRTDLLSPKQKMRFVGEISAIIANIHNVKQHATLGEYLAESNADEDVKELWEHLVCSNFFITPEEARKVPGHVISEYYQNLFRSSRPVNYILGSWAVITNQLKMKIELAGRWEIAMQEGVDSIRYADRKFILQTKNREAAFDKIIFAMPVQQVVKLLKGTAWEPFMAPYEGNTPTEVMVYDIGLNRVVARPFSYISDMDNKLFISDVSATDHTLVPEKGQLLQGIAYLNDKFDNEQDRKAYLDSRTEKMERLFDHYYPGWREAVEVKRVSKKAMVSSVKNIATNRLVPQRIENVPFYFCGDGCEGKGELAERAFSSARAAAKLIEKDLKQLAHV